MTNLANFETLHFSKNGSFLTVVAQNKSNMALDSINTALGHDMNCIFQRWPHSLRPRVPLQIVLSRSFFRCGSTTKAI